MKLWLLRHGEAEPAARTDAERNLTDYGRQQVRESAAQLLGRPLRAVLSAPMCALSRRRIWSARCWHLSVSDRPCPG